MMIASRAMQAASLAIVIGVCGLALPASGQQTPPATGTQPKPPMQPGPSMGAQMQQQGMEHGRMGQGMGMEGKGMGGANMQNMQTPGACSGGQCGGMEGSAMQGQMPGMGPSGVPAQSVGPQMMQMMMQGHMADLPWDHIEGRIAYLHAELQITEAQMPAWTEFANVLRANAKRIAEVQKAPQRTTTTAADRMDDQERWLTARLESVRALKPAYVKLYAALDDKQKKIADELLAPHMGMR
ncbi:MAG: Spy/CpxP family protein refolding chaperone [Rhodospirillales bacterium]|nr:Spy/CpxP family protein refolding chaperone [Rhodospirillales bacterium]